MRAMVVYESLFGNTEEIAHAVANGLSRSAAVEIFEVLSAPTKVGADIELLVVGAPTHAFGLSRVSSRNEAAAKVSRDMSTGFGVREWLEQVEVDAQRTRAAAFGTVVAEPRWVVAMGTAAGAIERRLRRLGLRTATSAQNFKVSGMKGPLLTGEEARAQEWGARLVPAFELRRPRDRGTTTERTPDDVLQAS